MGSYLAHHGILGQKWGIRNGTSYPLSPEDYSAEEKRLAGKLQKAVKKSTASARVEIYSLPVVFGSMAAAVINPALTVPMGSIALASAATNVVGGIIHTVESKKIKDIMTEQSLLPLKQSGSLYTQKDVNAFENKLSENARSYAKRLKQEIKKDPNYDMSDVYYKVKDMVNDTASEMHYKNVMPMTRDEAMDIIFNEMFDSKGNLK